MKYENKHLPPITKNRFVLRFFAHLGIALFVLIGSLYLGMIGYRCFEQLNWHDAFLNASMLLGGMGPVNAPLTESGKIFAGIYAMYSGLIFLVTVGIIFAPVVHYCLHKFHWDGNNEIQFG